MPNINDIVTLGRRQLYMLPTRDGLVFSLLLLVQLLIAVNYGNGLAYALTFLLGALAVVSMLYTHRNLFALCVTTGIHPAVFAGEPARFQFLLINHGRTPRFGVVVTHNKKEVACVDIPAGATVAVEVPLPTTRRGYLAAPALVVATRFPLGLLYSWSRRVELPGRCLVYPRPAVPTPLRSGAAAAIEPAAGHSQTGDDYIGARPFRSGDSPRHVDWKAVARGREWHIKQFGGAHQSTVWLDWDSLAGLATEARLSLLTRWVLQAQQHSLRYGLRLPGKTLAPDHDEPHLRACLTALALFA